jgi:acyl-CoA thioester hydrolase
MTKEAVRIPDNIRTILESHIFSIPWMGTLEEVEEFEKSNKS